MARSYGQIMASIWRDRDFLALPGDAQRVYMMLVSQPTISSAGTLALTITRWAKYASDSTLDSLSDSLSCLAAKRFVILDEDTEELLVRKFVKWDGGYTNVQKRQPAIRAAAEAVSSSKLRAFLRVELDALNVPHTLTDTLSDTHGDTHGDTPSSSQPDSPRIRVGLVLNPDPDPETRNHTQDPGTVSRANGPTEIAPRDTPQTITGRWLEHCRARPPKAVIGHVARHVKDLLAEGIDPRDVERGLAAWASKGLHPSTLPSVVNEVMNAPPLGARSRPATTDQRAAEALAVAAELRAEGQ